MKKTIIVVFLLAVVTAAVVQAQSVLDVDFYTLMKEIDNNKIRASQLYHNKTIRTTGPIGMLENGWFALESRTNYLFIYYASSERSKAINLNKGQRITVRGVYDGNGLYPAIRRAVIETQPTQPQAQQQQQAQTVQQRYNQGVEFYNNRNYDRAITEFTEAIRLAPNTSSYYSWRGSAYYGKGDNDRTIEDYNEAIRLDPNIATYYINRGHAYYMKKDWNRAIADYEAGLRIDPKNKNAKTDLENARQQRGQAEQQAQSQQKPQQTSTAEQRYKQGVEFYNNKNYDRAITEFTEAIRLAPNNAEYYGWRGVAYYGKGDNDRAIADNSEYIRLKPAAIGYLNRGDAYYNKKDWNRAIADYEAALRIEPNNADTKTSLENARQQRGQAEQQSQSQQKPQQTSTAEQRYKQGVEFYNNKNYDRAITEFTEAIRLAPNNAGYYAWRGYTYLQKNENDRAIADYTEAIRLAPNNASYYDGRGYAYYKKKDWNRAIADYEAALRIEPNNATAKTSLENARKARGK